MLESKFPYIASWIYSIGKIEMGEDEYSDSILRIVNEGGLIWEDNESDSIDEALEKAEFYLKNGLRDEFGIELYCTAPLIIRQNRVSK